MADVKSYDIVALTSICVDVRVETTYAVIAGHGFKVARTNPVTAAVLQQLIAGHEDKRTTGSPGGNVTAGIALRGGNPALIGKIANDDNGTFFTKRARAHGVTFEPLVSDVEGTSTIVAAALITPDKERSFAFLPGAGAELTADDIESQRALIENATITYLDSYLWLSESGKEAVHHAAAIARESGSRVAIALNDADIVANNREAFLALIQPGDILVGDRKEFENLLGTSSFEETVKVLKTMNCLASVTAGKDGAYIIHNSKLTHIPTKKVTEIVDTNGAGDQFAAGFLYGIATGKHPLEAGGMGARWAADVIQHAGAEPRVGKNAPVATPAQTQQYKLRA